VLWVTNIKFCERAVAAMIKSYGPIGVPILSKSARILPQISAIELLKSWLPKREKKDFKDDKTLSGLVLLYAP